MMIFLYFRLSHARNIKRRGARKVRRFLGRAHRPRNGESCSGLLYIIDDFRRDLKLQTYLEVLKHGRSPHLNN